jgi:dihydrofolate reductase
MRKLGVFEFVTLDGAMQAPSGPEEDRRGEFGHGGWVMPYLDEVTASVGLEGMAASGGLLLGRVTYESMAAYWPSAPAEDPFAEGINNLPKFVVSTTLQEPLAWNNSRLIKGDIAEEVAKLKRQPGKDLRILGSGELVHTLMQHNLIDEYRLLVFPIVLGSGRRLFRDGSVKTALRLVDTKTTNTGVVILTYQPAEFNKENYHG